MGDFRHRAIVVTTDFDGPEFRAAHAEVVRIMAAPERQHSLVSHVVMPHWNHGASFFVAPDGAKVGRDGADKADARRDKLKRCLRGYPGLNWVEVDFGHEGARVTADALSALEEEGL